MWILEQAPVAIIRLPTIVSGFGLFHDHGPHPSWPFSLEGLVLISLSLLVYH